MMFSLSLFFPRFRLKFIVILGGVTEAVSVKNNKDGTYFCQYTPTQSGQYVISVNYGGQPCSASPYRVSRVMKYSFIRLKKESILIVIMVTKKK